MTYVFWLMRCGETTWAREGRIRGQTDLPLSSSGRSAVCADVARLAGVKIAAVYHPGDEAAGESAHLVADATGAKIRKVEDLADPDLGLLEGLTEQMFCERYAKRFKAWREDPMALSPPDGESLIDARARLLESVARIIRRSKGNEIVFVLHDLAMGMLRCWLADQPTSDFWSVMKDRPRLERYGATSDQLEAMVALAQESLSEAG